MVFLVWSLLYCTRSWVNRKIRLHPRQSVVNDLLFNWYNAPVIHIRPMTRADVAAAKQVMYTVAAGIFAPDHPAASFSNRLAPPMSDVDDFERHYGPPGGAFLVTVNMTADGEQVIGTGAIRRIDDETAELRRMWLLPEYHGRAIGYRLATELLAFASAAGYRRVRLSTDKLQTRAIDFYRRLGFYPIERYRDTDDEVFLELALAPAETGDHPPRP